MLLNGIKRESTPWFDKKKFIFGVKVFVKMVPPIRRILETSGMMLRTTNEQHLRKKVIREALDSIKQWIKQTTALEILWIFSCGRGSESGDTLTEMDTLEPERR